MDMLCVDVSLELIHIEDTNQLKSPVTTLGILSSN